MNLVPVENQLSSGQPVEQEQRRLRPSEAERFEPEEEFEYVELNDRRRDVVQQRRYLDEPQPRYEQDLDDPRPLRDERRDKRREDPHDQNDTARLEESSPPAQVPPPPPRRAMPASRRPVQQSEEPMDVEPIRSQPPRRSVDDLEDPW